MACQVCAHDAAAHHGCTHACTVPAQADRCRNCSAPETHPRGRDYWDLKAPRTTRVPQSWVPSTASAWLLQIGPVQPNDGSSAQQHLLMRSSDVTREVATQLPSKSYCVNLSATSCGT